MKKGINIEENLLLDYLLGRSDEEGRKQVESWLQESKENRRQLDSLEKLWLESGRISPAPVAVDTDAAWNKFSMRIDLQAKETPTGKIIHFGRSRAYRYAFAAAATILLLAGLFSIYYFLFSSPKQIEIASDQTLVCDTLSDGTIVTLNRGSKLFYPETFDKKERIVRMEGEIFFRVKPDPEKPFVIVAGRAGIKVLGTSFDVTSRPGDSILVKVMEGKVAFYPADTVSKDTLILEGGMRGVLKPVSHHPEILNPSPDDLFWYDRSLVFHDYELQQVFVLLKLHYGVTVIVSDPSIKFCRLSASFKNENADAILRVIAETFNLRLSGKDQKYLLSGNGCIAVSQ